MARVIYPAITIGGTSPTAYWDFTELDTAGQGTGSPVAWTQGSAVTLDDDGVPECVSPAVYYDETANAYSTQANALYTNNTATWFVMFRPTGTMTSSPGRAVLSKCSTTASRYGFVLYYRAGITEGTTDVGLHCKYYAEPGTTAEVNITGGADTLIAAAFSFDTSTFHVSANCGVYANKTQDGGGSWAITSGDPLYLGREYDTYWDSFKGHVMRVATWQGLKATPEQLTALTCSYDDPCYNPSMSVINALMFSCNT